MTDRPTPRCPWCGVDMTKEWYHVDTRTSNTCGNYYVCPCGARSPSCQSEDAAYAAAMTRHVEPNRVLTVDEVMSLDPDGNTYIESRRGEIEVSLNSEIIEEMEVLIRDKGADAVKAAYGKYGRCWLRWPTDAERKSVPWNDFNA